ncbi:MAG: hypothetical protein FJX72_10245 [Armatimonadetes bacterium]|nr:hypothetical protein [Armatimonadota bacterium]
MRISAAGALIGLGPARAIRLLPQKPGPTTRDAAAIGPPGALAALSRFVASRPTTVSLLAAGRPTPVYVGYVPSDGDCILLEPAPSDPSHLSDRTLQQMADQYKEHSLASLRARGGKPTSGKLTVAANLSALSSQPSAVLFLLDGVPVALHNRPPYRVVWDTRDWQDGEHMIEVRALDERGAILTRSKTLVFVKTQG